MNPFGFKTTAQIKFQKNNKPLRLTVKVTEDPEIKVEMIDTN
jgi:hypothetical protein